MKKVVFISGVSSGFGYAISKQLVQNGHKVYGTIRHQGAAPEGVQALFMELTQPESIRDAVGKVLEKEGRIDVLINNAGMHSGGPLEDLPESIFKTQIETNVFGLMYVLQEVLPHMRAGGGGKIINISSIGGLTALPFQGIYSASKFAIEGITQALRMEVKPFNIKVIVLNPGDFKTRNTETRIKYVKPGGAYEKQFEHTLKIIEKDETGGMDPKYLALKVARIVDGRSNKQRYIIGSFIQRLAVVVKKIIPESLFSAIIANHYETGKVYKKQPSNN